MKAWLIMNLNPSYIAISAANLEEQPLNRSGYRQFRFCTPNEIKQILEYLGVTVTKWPIDEYMVRLPMDLTEEQFTDLTMAKHLQTG